MVPEGAVQAAEEKKDSTVLSNTGVYMLQYWPTRQDVSTRQ